MNQPLPAELLNALENIKGFSRKEFEDMHNEPESITSIRFNPDKFEKFSSSQTIRHPHFNLSEQVPWCEYGFYLNERPQFTLDPLLHAGVYYVQEASSMFLWEALKQNFNRDADIKILDLCAAPGGKTTLLASYFKNALIASNEVIKTRANILYENVTKWGTENIVITNNDAADFKRLENYFDLIVVDAPCSGSGLFRKDKEAINEWSENNVELCSQRQQRILADVYPALKHDGILIYSTCSYSEEEDEMIADWLIEYFNIKSLKLNVNTNWNIDETTSLKHKAFGYRFWPYKVKGEGFFISVFKNDAVEKKVRQSFSRPVQASSKEINSLQSYLISGNWLYIKQKETIRIIHKQFENDIALLQKNLYLKKAGVQLGELKNDQLIPHHELALSNVLNDNVKKLELTEEQALQYLRKKEIYINDAYKGWALCTFNNFSLGWIKILHNRVNNYYPTEWRIRKE